MKSKFFKDACELDSACEHCPPDKMCVCLRLSRHAFDMALERANELGISTGEYIENILEREGAKCDGQ